MERCLAGDRSIGQVAKDFDLTETAVRAWVHQAEVDAGKREGLTSEEREELARLRRENRRLQADVDLLKRATAFMQNPRLCRTSGGPGRLGPVTTTAYLHKRLPLAEHARGFRAHLVEVGYSPSPIKKHLLLLVATWTAGFKSGPSPWLSWTRL